ncbi:acyl-CoA dehydrogenase family protein [Nonomuraea dietziae]|uniref:acyl-CoA dehydrogenase family protein n=1 Tax=Nonomuraea dietziae TaxID=65515 RepID=UPI00341389F5
MPSGARSDASAIENSFSALARTTLTHERVMIASGPAMTGLTTLLEEVRGPVDATTAERIGVLTAESWALQALLLRSTLRQLSGLEPGAASSVLKLAATEHQRAVTTIRLERLGTGGAVDGGAVTSYLSLPAMLIGGGTREIQLNVVAERILRLPRA